MRENEKALFLAKQRLEEHMNNSPLAIIELDPKYRVIRWSEEAEKIFGWKANEILGKKTSKIRWTYEKDVHMVESLLTEMFSGKAPEMQALIETTERMAQ